MKKVLKYILFIAIGVGLLYLTFQGMDKNEIFKAFQNANYSWLALSFVLGYIAIVSRGLRWVLLLRPMGHQLSNWSSIHSVAFGYFFNLVVPRGGELARCTSLYGTSKVPVNESLGTVVLERIIDMILLLLLGGISFLLNAETFYNLFESAQTDSTGDSGSMKYVILGVIILLGVIGYIVFKTQKQNPIVQKVINILNGVVQGLKSFKNVQNKGAFILHTAIIWGCYALMTYVCFFSIEGTADMTLSDGLFLMIAGGLGMIIPAPGGTGSYHYLIKLGFIALLIANNPNATESEINATATTGATFAVLVHATQTLMMLIMGGAVASIGFILAKRKNTAIETQ
ncbi:MAG: flippase-like domain-containing protein [Flavobacteriales bacterium]|nr:flippase-like domain-containing protein [Flavobacteriales bacterium]